MFVYDKNIEIYYFVRKESGSIFSNKAFKESIVEESVVEESALQMVHDMLYIFTVRLSEALYTFPKLTTTTKVQYILWGIFGQS